MPKIKKIRKDIGSEFKRGRESETRHRVTEKEKKERRLGYTWSWKSIFHRIERFALPGIFLSFTKGVATCA